MKKRYSFILALLLMGIVLYLSRGELSNTKIVRTFQFSSIIWISFFFLLAQLTFAVQLKVVLSVFSINLKFVEWFGLISIQSLGNYLPFSGGTISNIAYLKVNKKLPVSDYLGYLAGDTVLKIAIYGALGLGFLFGNWILFNQFNATIFLIIGIFFVLGLLLVFLPSISLKTDNKPIRWIISLHEGWIKIRNNAKVLTLCILTHILTLVFISLQYYFIFKELHFQFNILSIFVLTIITNLVRIASLFPGNIGLRESVSGMVLLLLGFPFGIGVTASLLGRIINMFWIFLFGSIFSYILLNSKPEPA